MAINDPTPDNMVRYYTSVKTGGEFEKIYAEGQVDVIAGYLSSVLFKDAGLPETSPLNVTGLPTRPLLDQKIDEEVLRRVDRRIVRHIVDKETWRKIQAAEKELRNKGELSGVARELPVFATRHWCPSTGGGPFADRTAAERLIGVEALRAAQPALRGKGVNIALFDHGIDKRKIPSANFGGGWPGGTRPPGHTIENGHGMAMVRQLLSVAPDAVIFDYPVLPPRITDIPTFLGEIHAAYHYFLAEVAVRGGRWVAVNAWSTFNRPRDHSLDDYSNNPDHRFNLKMSETVDAGIDVVFAAGNCGQFCPSGRCGRSDRGPGNSIFGANSHARVLTVGAVRSDGLWIGYSSQGEGQPELAKEKPDICASSDFRETNNAGMISSGTSAACALTAGVIAALRSNWPATVIAPDQLKAILISTARQTQGAGWNNRLGHGILDAKAAFDAAQAFAENIS